MVSTIIREEKTQTKEVKRRRKADHFPKIAHWDDPEIGYKALLRCIKIYVNYKHEEFKRLAPVITKDEFIWDTFSNICRRDGYPQYDKSKNKGNFYSFVQTCCIRNQADWARKRNTKALQLAKLQGKVEVTGKNEHVNYFPVLNLDEFIIDSDDMTKHEKICGESIWDYTEELALEDISKSISDERISEKFSLSWKEFAQMLMKGWTVVDISKELEVNPTTTRKYYGILKQRLLQDQNIQELLKMTGMNLQEVK